ncbi:sulfite exporter TauE/SafE family protein [Methanolobus sp. ZRKC3]|uniref:sulfite exporter TauE/SafE family protein n=1 Tax=Methanolobus sp. ZRKC3 TaxID=3125786 RepID=UPI003252A1EF
MDPFFIVLAVLLISSIFSMLGLGGAIFYVPFFYWTGMELVAAITTALLLNTVSSGSAAVTYLRKNMVDLQTALPFVIGSMTGAQIGAYFSRYTPVDTLLFAFSILMTIVGLEMIFSRAVKFYSKDELQGRRKITVILISGMVIGIISGMLGIGGGSLIVPLLLIIGFKIKRAAATSGFIVFFTSISGFIAHFSNWEPDYTLVFYIVLASFTGAQIGSHLMYNKVKAESLRKAFGAILLIIAFRIISTML